MKKLSNAMSAGIVAMFKKVKELVEISQSGWVELLEKELIQCDST